MRMNYSVANLKRRLEKRTNQVTELYSELRHLKAKVKDLEQTVAFYRGQQNECDR